LEMPKKTVSSKVAAANEKKAQVKAEKDSKIQAQKEQLEAQEWKKGSKDSSSKEEAEKKRLEALAKKEERRLLLEMEEASLPSKARQAPKIDEFAASGIDDSLMLMQLSTKSSASIQIEKHPEKRVKSAYATFEELQMPIIKVFCYNIGRESPFATESVEANDTEKMEKIA
jgi:hypothetical protein